MRKFRDRDFILTKEGFFFCVVGPLHPRDRVISYFKYVPEESGLWGKGKRKFKRVLRSYTIPSLLETFNSLKREYPHYLFHSSFFKITMTAVPKEYIAEHYKPEEKMAQLFESSNLDSLQKKLRRLVPFLSENSGVSSDFFGVTGSILIDIHRPEFSDIDITVYGLKNSLALKEALFEAYSSSNSTVKRLEGSSLREWCNNKAERYPLQPQEALKIYERKWNVGFFEDIPFSIHPVKLEQEVAEEYGDKTYFPEGSATIRAVVWDNSDCLFLPAVYRVKDVNVVEGPKSTDIQEVVSYESLYDNLAQVDELIVVRGKLEHVVDRTTGQKHDRILVGSPEGRGMEYIKLSTLS